MDEDIIARNIKTLRKQRKITLEKLGDLTGLTKGYLSKIERSKKAPPYSTLNRIALALNVDAAFLLGERLDGSFGLGWKLTEAIALSTASFVCFETGPLLLITRETVLLDTCANFAISLIVTAKGQPTQSYVNSQPILTRLGNKTGSTKSFAEY